jgi:glycosyltransferase involved in cell wall biosynthesis
MPWRRCLPIFQWSWPLPGAVPWSRRCSPRQLGIGASKSEALAWADHLLLPSLWYENAPVVVLEAAAYGLSLIASRIGGIPEFVREGVTGRLFDPGDPEALAQAMMAAPTDTAMMANLAAAGQTQIAQYTVARMVDGFTEHYRRLASVAG